MVNSVTSSAMLCRGAQYQRLTIIQDVEGVSEVDNTFGLY